MSRPDVVLISPYPTTGQRHAGPSGVASYTANLAHALVDRGAHVEVVAPREPDAPGEPYLSLDGEVTVHRAFERGPRGLGSAVVAARGTGAPVVHLQHEMFLYGGPATVPASLPALAALRRQARTVVTLHQVVDPRTVDQSFTQMHRVKVPALVARAALGCMQRSISALSSACIVHERSFADVVRGAVVIPHGVEERITPDRGVARAELGLDDRLVALCFGFLAPYKGLEAVLEAGRALGPDEVQIVVAGGAHPRLAAAGDAYGAELEGRYRGPGTRFTGWVPEDDVARWFAAADVALFAYPAPFSSSGALALAFAHGTPVMMSASLAECVGAAPGLVMPADPGGLADRLRSLLDPDVRLDLARLTTPLAAGRDWAAVAERHLDLYAGMAT